MPLRLGIEMLVSFSLALMASKDVRGGFNLQTTGDVDCEKFKSQAGSNKAIKGVFKCEPKSSAPGNINSSGDEGDKEGAASSLFVHQGTLLVGAAAVVAVFMGTL